MEKKTNSTKREKDCRIKTLDKIFLENSVHEFINIAKDVKHEYWQKEHFMIDLPGKWEYSLVAVGAKNDVIGYVIASKKDSNIHIHKFMIKKSLRGLAIGKKLLTELCNRCMDARIKTVTLKVYQDNVRAIGFYKRCLFKRIGVEKGGILRMSAVPKQIKDSIENKAE